VSAPWYHWDADTLILNIRVVPRTAKDEIAGVHGDRLRIRITAPPVDGKANQHLLEYLASLCGVPKGRVQLLSGSRGRDKRIGISDPKRFPDGVESPKM